MLGFILHLIKIMPISDGMYYAEPLSALAIAGLAMGGLKSLGGLGQMIFSGRKKAEPKYEIPQEVFRATQMAQEMAQTGMPAAALSFEQQAIDRSSLMAQRAAADRRAGLATIGTTIAQRDLSLGALSARNANIMQQNQRFAQQALMTQAQYRDKAFANEFQSYMNKEQQRRSNLGAGMHNVFGGLDFAGSMAAMGLLGGGGLGTGSAPGFGGSTYNPMSQFLSGSIPGINYRSSLGITSPTYNLSPSSLSLYRGPQAFNSNILRNP
jgi:hypothetical protein